MTITPLEYGLRAVEQMEPSKVISLREYSARKPRQTYQRRNADELRLKLQAVSALLDVCVRLDNLLDKSDSVAFQLRHALTETDRAMEKIERVLTRL